MGSRATTKMAFVPFLGTPTPIHVLGAGRAPFACAPLTLEVQVWGPHLKPSPDLAPRAPSCDPSLGLAPHLHPTVSTRGTDGRTLGAPKSLLEQQQSTAARGAQLKQLDKGRGVLDSGLASEGPFPPNDSPVLTLPWRRQLGRSA